MAKREPFAWQGVEHWTGADLMTTLMLIDDQETADDFILAYADVCEDEEHALHNVGYLCEIIRHDSDNDEAEEDAERLRELFDVDYQIQPRNWFKGSSLGVKLLKSGDEFTVDVPVTV